MMLKRQIKLHHAAIKSYKSPTSCDLLVAPGENEHGQKYVQILIRAHGSLTSDVVCGLTLSEEAAREHVLTIQKGLDMTLSNERAVAVEIPAFSHVVNVVNAAADFTQVILRTGQPRSSKEADEIEIAGIAFEQTSQDAKSFCQRVDSRDPLLKRFSFLSSFTARNDEEEADVQALDRVLRIRGDHPGWPVVDREVQA